MKSHSPSSCLEKLHIPNEFAHLIGINCGTRGHHQTVLLVSPFGKAWHVEVGRDGEGAFLGCGWPEFVQAYDAGVGWFVSFRYEGNIVLTVKLYDTSCCFKDFATQFADLATRKSSAASHTLQFVKVLPRDSMDVMQIPDNFVCCYIPKAQRNSQVAIIFSSLGKFWHIGFDSNESGVFLRGNWLEFLEAHDLSEGNILVFRYEGSMVFTVKRLNPLGTRKCTMPRELVFSQVAEWMIFC